MFPYVFMTPENILQLFALKNVFQMRATLRCAEAQR